jgi:hypothetical protein
MTQVRERRATAETQLAQACVEVSTLSDTGEAFDAAMGADRPNALSRRDYPNAQQRSCRSP